MPKSESLLFLKSLKEDGIEQVYVPSKSSHPVIQSQIRQILSPPNVLVGGLETKSGFPLKTCGNDNASAGINPGIEQLRSEVLKCKLCAELAKTRNKVVFGDGHLQAQLVFVGEAPGADEDEQGLPFVGRAGQLLTKIIEAMGMTRDQVFICNVLKCRPPHNRPPAPAEVAHCRPFLKRQLEIIKPKVIVALGNHAVKALLQTEQGISQLRGTFQQYEGIPVMCTYHPAYLLRSPGEKRKVWEDMKKVIKFLNASED
ncbi:MAG: uracil-DNA glycosylase [Candidatus Omnitrophota bacterium]